ncbi:restriction endonuclease subunit S [Flavobacterium filum]|uniref:restriction endonuclease subunit S n=1 Tax=Flavobacterium filum TaxID=370974 RepID=UPI0023F4A551|nr:restriction endonuclease subunit S [Flavobacterium filum]
MKSNYKRIGEHIRLVDERNKGLEVKQLLGLSISKQFIPSVANIIGTDMENYKIIRRNQFACSTMQVRRDKKMPVALLQEVDEAIISQAYPIFEVKNEKELLPEYLMMWFTRSEFDREACFHAVGGVRGSLEWEDFENLQFPVPHIDKQRAIVKEYNTIVNRIALNNQLIKKLEETAQAIYNSYLNNEDDKESHRLGDLMEIKGGFSYNSEDLGKGSTYLLGMGCVSFSDRFVEDGMRLYSDNIPEQHIVNPKDIIIATRQQSENMPILGCPAMIPPNLVSKKMVIASNLYRVVNKSKLSNEILYQIMKSVNYQEHIKLHTKGTTVGMITKDAIEDYTFEAPSIEFLYSIQNNITKIIDNVFLKNKENQKLTELKELLLSKLATVV